MNSLFRFCSSLTLAILILLGFTVALIVGTFVESLYDMQTAGYYVYRAWWFKVLMFLLGVNITAVAISRWPWKRRHAPFLLAHLGIILMLFGSYLTQVRGLDATLVVNEGQVQSAVELTNTELVIRDGNSVVRRILPWIPPSAKFKPVSIEELGLEISEYLTHSEAVYEFGPSENRAGPRAPALKLKLKGGPFSISRQYWLWAGDPQWSTLPIGPAFFNLIGDPEQDWSAPTFDLGNRARMEFRVRGDGGLDFQARSLSQKNSDGRIPASDVKGKQLQPGWMGITVVLEEFHQKATNLSYHKPSRTQYGDQAPPGAIFVQSPGVEGSGIWIGEGETAFYQVDGRTVEMFYKKQRQVLPFSIKLERFTIEKYDGTNNPSSFESRVKVIDPLAPENPITIKMNEPLDFDGHLVYQSSYIPKEPRPTTSIFTVNRDPGREIKYIGSIIIFLGGALLFAVKVGRWKWLLNWMGIERGVK